MFWMRDSGRVVERGGAAAKEDQTKGGMKSGDLGTVEMGQ